VAYILFDLLFYHATIERELAFHHVFSVAAVWHTLLYSPATTIEVTFRCLAAETSTIFLCLRPAVKPYPTLKYCNDLLFFVSFSVFRVGALLPLSLFTFWDSGWWSSTSAFMAMNVILNAYWYKKILHTATKRFHAAPDHFEKLEQNKNNDK